MVLLTFVLLMAVLGVVLVLAKALAGAILLALAGFVALALAVYYLADWPDIEK